MTAGPYVSPWSTFLHGVHQYRVAYSTFRVAMASEGLPEVSSLFIRGNTEELMASALLCSNLTTAILWAGWGGWDVKTRYISVCVHWLW